MRDLGRRTLTGLVYGAVFVAAVVQPAPWLTLVVVALFVVGLWELARLTARLPTAAATIASFLVGALVLGGGLFSLLYLTSYPQTGIPAPGAAPPVSFFISHPWIVLAIVPTWAADIAAYVAGSLLGRRKLIPRISPGKTWEGTIAGFIAGAAVAWLVARLAFMDPLTAGTTAFVAIAIGPAALAGDLLESALKRAAGVKDSGAIFPGHGGVLDRIDSLLVVAPVVALTLFTYRSGMMGT